MQTHQDLLEGYIRAKLSCIHERSGDISGDATRLKTQMVAYAAGHGLVMKNEWFEHHIVKDDVEEGSHLLYRHDFETVYDSNIFVGGFDGNDFVFMDENVLSDEYKEKVVTFAREQRWLHKSLGPDK